jgi:chemotaxis response regulator CheB
MPGAAVKLGGAQQVLPLHRIAAEMLHLTADHPNGKMAHA